MGTNPLTENQDDGVDFKRGYPIIKVESKAHKGPTEKYSGGFRKTEPLHLARKPPTQGGQPAS